MEKSLKLFTFIVVLLCFGISSAFAQSSGSDSGITLGRFDSGDGSGLENAEVEEITAEEIGLPVERTGLPIPCGNTAIARFI